MHLLAETRRLLVGPLLAIGLLTGCGASSDEPASGGTIEATSTTTASTTSPSTAPTSTTTTAPSTTAAPTSTVEPSTTSTVDPELAAVLDTGVGAGDSGDDVVPERVAAFEVMLLVGTKGDGLPGDPDLLLEVGVALCAGAESAGSDLGYTLLVGRAAEAASSFAGASPFSPMATANGLALVDAAMIGLCNDAAQAAHAAARDAATQTYTPDELRFLVLMRSGAVQEFDVLPDADLLAAGRAACAQYPGMQAADLSDAVVSAFEAGDKLTTLATTWAGSDDALCPEHAAFIADTLFPGGLPSPDLAG